MGSQIRTCRSHRFAGISPGVWLEPFRLPTANSRKDGVARGPGRPRVAVATLDGDRVLRSGAYDSRRRPDYRENSGLLAQAGLNPYVRQIDSRRAKYAMTSSRHEATPRS